MSGKILLIEDEKFLADVLSQKLRHEGYDVTLTQDGAEGLRLMRALKPDLILLDIILPTMSGYEILEARHTDPALMNIPVIVISNSGQPVEITRVLALGVRDYLIKVQLEPEEVLEKVRQYLQEVVPKLGTARLEGKKVMSIEDDTFLRDILGGKLIREGAVLIKLKSGEEALKLFETEHPDVILLDLILPGMNGFDILKLMKENPQSKDIPVIVLSNLGQTADIERLEKLGATRHLIKAEHDPDEIIDIIVSVLKTSDSKS
ncbi:MAG TPA: response regulator [Candidatus Paceibacterota bacterium]|nr:response regulator [Candidatus Paceibacterota bacterium]